MPSPIKQQPNYGPARIDPNTRPKHAGLYIFLSLMEQRTRHLFILIIWALWWLEKQCPLFFSSRKLFWTHLWPKTPRKHSIYFVKPIHGSEKHTKPPQNLKSTRNKKTSRAHIRFLSVFNIKKHLILTPVIWNHLTQQNKCFGS